MTGPARLHELAAQDLALRVHGEFTEMPGLRLNLQQAQRLLGLDASRCEAILSALVERGLLTCAREGLFALRGSQP